MARATVSKSASGDARMSTYSDLAIAAESHVRWNAETVIMYTVHVPARLLALGRHAPGAPKHRLQFISDCRYNITLNLSFPVWLAGSINAGLCLQAGKAIQDADAPRLMQAIFI